MCNAGDEVRGAASLKAMFAIQFLEDSVTRLTIGIGINTKSG